MGANLFYRGCLRTIEHYATQPGDWSRTRKGVSNNLKFRSSSSIPNGIAMRDFPVNYAYDQGYFDRIQFETCGLISLDGWFWGQRIEALVSPKCFIGNDEIPVFQVFRTYRPDVAANHGSDDFFQGLIFTYRVSDLPPTPIPLRLSINDKIFFEITQSFQVYEPTYVHLLNNPDVLHRENIYGFGPPATFVNEEVVQLARMLPAPILDFGCGRGVLVKRLRDEGIEAYGIEIERGPIVDSILPEVTDFIHLYQGDFPLPYKSGEFQSVLATEVIEHVNDYEDALSEIARVTNSHFTMTVPDMSSIPICEHNFVVPWHLLESTHANFFNQTSLERLLRKYFSEIEFARICPVATNASQWFVSLVGMCRK